MNENKNNVTFGDSSSFRIVHVEGRQEIIYREMSPATARG